MTITEAIFNSPIVPVPSTSSLERLYFNIDYLLEFNQTQFDIIIGNPPYIENKKIKDLNYKKKLLKRFKSAYKLYDFSILFIEKSIEILKEKYGYLSFIMPNKFLAANYGIKIRKLLVSEIELKGDDLSFITSHYVNIENPDSTLLLNKDDSIFGDLLINSFELLQESDVTEMKIIILFKEEIP